MLVGEICNREVIIANRDDSIVEVAKLMRNYHVGDVVVTSQKGNAQVPVGIMTDRDIVVELVAKQVDMQTITVGDAMSPEVLTAQETEQLTDLVQRMRTRGVRRAPVVDDQGALIGIVAVDDVIGLLAEQLSNLVSLVQKEERREEKARP